MSAVMYIGDAVQVMNRLPEKSVDLVLTSPPFLALRSYLPTDHPDKALEGGSQSTPGAFIDWLIDVVEACDRVLAPHGSLCLELGDTYSGSGGGGGDYLEGGWREGQAQFAGSAASMKESNAAHWRQKNPPKPRDDGGRYAGGYSGGSKGHNVDASNGAFEERPGRASNGWPLAKSLSLIPELFRLTLVYGFNPLTGRQTERWRLRNVVRWVRPNPPVGALGDKFRPATSELMVFCKSAKRYFDLDAVREPHKRIENIESWSNSYNHLAKGEQAGYTAPMHPGGAPPLDWWNIPPGGYNGAHYAVMPAELCVKPVKAMCPEKVCQVCGEPSRRIVELEPGAGGYHPGNNGGSDTKGTPRLSRTLRAESFSDCSHDDWRPGLVLDPFGGSGTTALVATGHGRDCILIDLDERNYDLALERVGPLVLSKGEVAA